jgi:biopolymer transport protein ExbD
VAEKIKRLQITGDVGEEPKLNMTPMIDVVFQLLLFFMLVTEMSKMEAEAISLPTATKGIEDRKPLKNRLVINVKKEGTIVINRREFSPRGLRGYLHGVSVRFRDADGLSTLPVKIRADANVQYKYVQQVMVQCMREYIWKLSFGCMKTKDAAKLHSAGG